MYPSLVIYSQLLYVKIFGYSISLPWRHNGHDGVSNHQPHDCLLNRYSGKDQRKHQSSASLAFVRGIHRDRWIPRTKGQQRGKCFHLMTSSCIQISYVYTLVILATSQSWVCNKKGCEQISFYTLLHSLRCGDAYMSQLIVSLLVQVKLCWMLGAKLFPKSMLPHHKHHHHISCN